VGFVRRKVGGGSGRGVLKERWRKPLGKLYVSLSLSFLLYTHILIIIYVFIIQMLIAQKVPNPSTA